MIFFRLSLQCKSMKGMKLNTVLDWYNEFLDLMLTQIQQNKSFSIYFSVIIDVTFDTLLCSRTLCWTNVASWGVIQNNIQKLQIL